MSPPAAQHSGNDPALSRMIALAIVCALLVYLVPVAGTGAGQLRAWLGVGDSAMRADILLVILFLGLRGGVFCLFPGWVLRNRRVLIIGFVCGFGADAVISTWFSTMSPAFEARYLWGHSIPEALIPPLDMRVAPFEMGSPPAAAMVLHHGMWMGVMLTIWAAVWRPKLNPAVSLAAVVAGTGAAACMMAGLASWGPPGWSLRAESGWPIGPFLALLVIAMPGSAAAAAMTIHVGRRWGTEIAEASGAAYLHDRLVHMARRRMAIGVTTVASIAVAMLLGAVVLVAAPAAAHYHTVQRIEAAGGSVTTAPVGPPWLSHLYEDYWLRPVELVVTDAEVTEDDLRVIGTMTRLKKLTLMNVDLDDEDLSHLTRLSRLRVLGLGATPLTDRAIEHLRELKQLEELYYPFPLSPQELSDLAYELPGVRVRFRPRPQSYCGTCQ